MTRKPTAQAAAERSQLAMIIRELKEISERLTEVEKDQRRMAHLIWKEELAAMAETTDRPGE